MSVAKAPPRTPTTETTASPPGRSAASATAISEGLGAGGARRPPTPILRASSTRRIAMHGLPTYDDVAAAARRLDGHAHRTPVLTSRTADEATGATLYFKCENFQRMGAFKFRGAFNALSCFDTRQRRHGVVAFSSGNHAQAVALSARLLGMPATIVMPQDAPRSKIDATRGYGATVVLYD